MKNKSLSILLIPILAMLSACNNNSIAGKYGFQMGKEKGTHFGIFLTLTNEYVTLDNHPEETNKYKKCKYSFSLGAKEGEKSDSLISIVKMISQLLGDDGEDNDINIDGYYYKGDKIEKSNDYELKMGIDLSYLKEIFEEIDPSFTLPELDPDAVEKLVYTTYGEETITMNIPVGEVDIIYQLYWYGIDFTYDQSTGLDTTQSACGVHNPGTHPTKEDVEKINKEYNYQTTHSFFKDEFGLDVSEYRDYYTLGMGLVKQH